MKYSIIITAYNSEKHINLCLDSLVNQTNQNFSVIIVDDGSTDKTKDKIKPYLKKLNIKYYYKKNTGVSDTRNYGIRKVKTPYFLFLDSDDYLENNLIEVINKYDDYEVLSFQSLKINANKNIIEKLNKSIFDKIDGKSFLKSVMKKKSNFFLSPWGYVFNKTFWDKNKFKFPKKYIMEDAGLIPLVLLNSNKIISIDHYGYYYVQTNESIMRTTNEKKIQFKTESILFQYDNLMDHFSKIKLENDLKKSLDDYFAGWLLWYGTTLNNEYLNEYIKELNRRNVLKKLKKNIKVMIKILICKINYKLYFKLYNLFHR